MVDPARVVAANVWIDYLAVIQAKIECVRIVLVVGSGFPGGAFASVFDNACTSDFRTSICTARFRVLRFFAMSSGELSRKKKPGSKN